MLGIFFPAQPSLGWLRTFVLPGGLGPKCPNSWTFVFVFHVCAPVLVPAREENSETTSGGRFFLPAVCCEPGLSFCFSVADEGATQRTFENKIYRQGGNWLLILLRICLKIEHTTCSIFYPVSCFTLVGGCHLITPVEVSRRASSRQWRAFTVAVLLGSPVEPVFLGLTSNESNRGVTTFT